jgi:hypothetical protein
MFFKYLWYIIKHKWYVLIECWRRGLIWRGITHDLSKLRPSEFFPYMHYFYGQRDLKDSDFWNTDTVNSGMIINIQGEEWYMLGYWEKEKVWKAVKYKWKKLFDQAWLAHQNRNDHHWQFWILVLDQGDTEGDCKNKLLPMSDKAMKEMVCDWSGAGKAITGKNDVIDWYRRNKKQIELHSETRRQVEKRLFRRY